MDTLIQSLDFIDNRTPEEAMACDFKVTEETNTGKNRKLYIESYGCQMNYSDSEIVSSIMSEDGYDTTSRIEEADVIFLNTCSIREKAEKTVRDRLKQIKQYKKKNRDLQVGILGCMAERLKKSLLEEEKIVDLVVGPDAYRDLPNLLNQVDEGNKAVNVLLSREETYADINPIRLNSNGISAFVSIMRGCDNMCSFCVVPFTRGRERSRDAHSVLREVQGLLDAGYKEVTLLGQNVDSYKWTSEDGSEFVNFANLLEMVANLDKNLRVRFSTSHPKDITDEVLHTMKKYDNICKYIHLPVQSGNSRVLELMNRTYDREWYMNRVNAIRDILGEECGISSDMIAGFCTETEEDHLDTLSMMDFVQYDYSYMFFYSERPGTLAARKLEDDIPLEVKKRRLAEIIEKQRETSLSRNKLDIGKVHKVLVEGFSKKSNAELMGRNDQNKVVVFPKKHFRTGQYVNVFVTDCSVGTLFGEAID